MTSVKKLSDVELATLFKRLKRVFFYHEKIFWNKFEGLYLELKSEIQKRNRALIYKEAVKHLRIGRYDNQFRSASKYADAVINDIYYFTEKDSWEMGSFYTKSGHPVLIDLVCAWSKI